MDKTLLTSQSSPLAALALKLKFAETPKPPGARRCFLKGQLFIVDNNSNSSWINNSAVSCEPSTNSVLVENISVMPLCDLEFLLSNVGLLGPASPHTADTTGSPVLLCLQPGSPSRHLRSGHSTSPVRLKGKVYFLKLHLKAGFHQKPLNPSRSSGINVSWIGGSSPGQANF